MTISFDCPECGRNYVLKDELAGKKIKCKGCEAAIRVPESAAAEDDFDDLPIEESTGSAEDDFLQDLNRKSKGWGTRSSPASRKPAKPNKSSTGMITGAKWALGIGGGLLGVLLLCCGVPSLFGLFAFRHFTVGETAPAGMSFEQWRASIPTKLTEHGPSPQDYEDEEMPPDVTQVMYPSGDLQLKACVYRPPGVEEPRPALVYFHGGFAFGVEDLTETCQPFMDAGFVVMGPMLRGENGNPGEFQMFYGEIDDARAACQWLAQQPYVNKDRIYTFGHSIGGGVSAMLSMMDNVPIRHGGSSGGMYDQLTFLGWNDMIPFENTPRERSVRLLVGNTQLMQRTHYAYVGIDDDPFDDVVEKLHSTPVEKLKVETVPGDHFTSFDESIRRYLKVVEANP